MLFAIDFLNNVCRENPELYSYLICKNKRSFRNFSIMMEIRPTKKVIMIPSGKGCGTIKQGALWRQEGRALPTFRGKCCICNTLPPALKRKAISKDLRMSVVLPKVPREKRLAPRRVQINGQPVGL